MKEKEPISEELIKIQEMDRERIARDLHDTSLQNLTHVIHKINLAELYLDTDISRTKIELEECRNNIKEIIDSIRKTIFYTQPMTLNDIGLTDTLHQYFENVNQDKKINVSYEIDTVEKLDTEKTMHIYRSIQECVKNSIRHSSGTHLKFVLKKLDNEIRIVIEDNGDGFDVNLVKKNHYGLQIVKRRISLINGTFSIFSKEKVGTRIEIIVPLE